MTAPTYIPSGREVASALSDGSTKRLARGPVAVTAARDAATLTLTLTRPDKSGPTLVAVREDADGAWTLSNVWPAHPDGNPITLPPDFVAAANALLRGDGFHLRVNHRTGFHVLVGNPGGRLPLYAATDLSTGPAQGTPTKPTPTSGSAPKPPRRTRRSRRATPAQVVAPSVSTPAVAGASAPVKVQPVTGSQRLVSPTPPKHAGEVVLPDSIIRRMDAAHSSTMAGHPVVIMLAGPTGTAKTHTARWFARRWGKPVVVFSCAGIRDPLEWFGNVGATDGTTYVAKSDLIKAWSDFSTDYVLVLDEGSRAQGFAFNAIMQGLEGAGWLTHPLTGERVDLNPRTQVIITANEGYVHTEPLDEAIWSRIGTWVRLDYLDEAEERRLLKARFPRLPKRDADNLAALALRVRAIAARDPGVKAVSTRQIHEAAALMVAAPSLPRREAVDSAILDAFGPNERDARMIVAGEVNGIIWDGEEPATDPATQTDPASQPDLPY